MKPDTIKKIYKLTSVVAILGGLIFFIFSLFSIGTENYEYMPYGLILWGVIGMPAILINFWAHCYYPGKEEQLVYTGFGSMKVTRRSLFKITISLFFLL